MKTESRFGPTAVALWSVMGAGLLLYWLVAWVPCVQAGWIDYGYGSNCWFGDPFEENAPCPPDTCCPAGGSGGGGGGGGSGGGPPSTPSPPAPGTVCFRAPCFGGMPVWHVTEPEANLWIEDQPLLYRPSLGPEVRVLLRYKDQSGKQDDFRRFDTNVFCLGSRWSFSLCAYVETTAIDNPDAWLFTGDGRTIQYTLGADNFDYGTQSTLVWSTNQYILSQPDGSKEYYSVGTEGMDMRDSTTVYRYFLRSRVDPQGNALTFNYTTNGTVRLTSVVDANSRTTQLSYITTNAAFAALVWKVIDPESNVVELKYSSSGCLTNIIDVAGIDSRMEYDANQNLLCLKTPYGQTSFDFPFDTNQFNLRAVKVTEPTGGVHLFLAGKQFDSDLVPDTDTPPPTEAVGYANTFNNGNLSQWNSFCWGPRQYALLSSTAKAHVDTNDVEFSTYLTATDYQRGRMRHWLTRNGGFGTTLALERDPSPDGTAVGKMTWYDHEGKSGDYNQCEGAMRLPRCVAVTMPDNADESMFTWTPRNTLGRPTREITTWTDPSGQWSTRTNWFGYSADNLDLLVVTNAFGQQVSSNLYTSAHLVAANWNALNEIARYAYNTKGQLTNLSRPSGLQTAYLYFTNGTYVDWLDKVIDYEAVSGTNLLYRTNAYTYAGGRVYTSTDARGWVVTNYWDGLGRLMGQADGGGSVTNLFMIATNTYAGSSGGTILLDVTASRDRNGVWTHYTYDGLRLLTGVTDANTNSTWYSYCDCGVIENVTTAMTNVTSYFYDDAGRLLATSHPSGLEVINVYDTANRLVSVQDSFGAVTNTYNNQGLITTVSNVVGRLSSASYDLGDRVTSRTDANGVTTSFGYDDLGRLTTRLVSGTATETNTYSARGLVAYVNSLGITNWFGYDGLGRKVAETNGNLEVTQFSYGPAGDLLALIDGRGKQTGWGYDQYGQVTNKVDHNGVMILRYQYDAGARLTNRWSKGKGNTAYGYDAVGNLTNVTYEANTNSVATNVVRYAYDKENRLTTMVDSAGTTTYGYSNGLLASENGPWADDTVSYAYNNGQRQALAILQPNTAAWVESYGYDGGRRLTNVTSAAGTFAYTYAGPGSLVTNVALPGGWAITNQFDAVGRLSGTWLRTATGTIANLHQYTYNNGSQRTRQTRLAGDYVDYTYDPAGQLKTAVGRELGGVTNRLAERFGYAYDAGGNLQYRTNNALVQSFGVDNVNQLTTVGRGGTLTVAGGTSATATGVTVADNGNWAVSATLYADKTFVRSGVSLLDGTNTFTAVATDGYGRGDTNTVTVNLPASVSYTYDDNGNLVSDGQMAFEYDGENQLVAVEVAGSWRSEFLYDGKLRRRVRVEKVWQSSQWVTASETRYIYDGMLVVQERDANNLPAVTYTRGRDLSGTREGAGGIGGLLARTDNRLLIAGDASAHACYHADGNGNVTALANSPQGILARYLCDPYGNLLAKAGSLADANLYRFSSKEVHAISSLYCYGYRYYAPSLQRWVNRDPLVERGGLNLYGYASNEPLGRYDPFGEADPPKDQPPVASPPVFGEKVWNANRDNCLCYALDRPGRDLQPDGSRFGRNNATNCRDLLVQIKKNYKEVVDVPEGGKCPSGSHMITVFSDGKTAGYHVQRQDADGNWSELDMHQYQPRRCKKGKGPGKYCGALCAPDQPKTLVPLPLP